MRILFLISLFVFVGLVFIGSSVSAQTFPITGIPGNPCDTLANCENFCLANESNYQNCVRFLEDNNLDWVLSAPGIKCGADACVVANTRFCACGDSLGTSAKPFCFIQQSYVTDSLEDCENVKAGLPPIAFSLPTSGVPGTGNQFLDTMQVISNWVFAIMLAVSVIFILMAGLDFINSEGDPERIKMARMKVTYSVIGIAAALAVFGFPTILRSVMGVN
tara:strand:- start:371 stop:1027 length:657 start_codon:yes stop_codon:yes gene_type:complete